MPCSRISDMVWATKKPIALHKAVEKWLSPSRWKDFRGMEVGGLYRCQEVGHKHCQVEALRAAGIGSESLFTELKTTIVRVEDLQVEALLGSFLSC